MPSNQNVTQQVGVFKGLVNRGRLAFRLIRDPRVPIYLKVIPAAALLYVVSPLDFIPDIAVGLGQLDDIGILLAGIEGFIALCPQYVVEEHQAEINGIEPFNSAATGSTPNAGPAETIDGEYRVK
jgi:uncharacterized membrane protein YkvA (DUF1232 family)